MIAGETTDYSPKRWSLTLKGQRLYLWTSARPGRPLGKKAAVPDDACLTWLQDLRNKARPTAIVSLLGWKDANSKDEHSFYSFKTADGFARWMAKQAPEVRFLQYPTRDGVTIPDDQLSKIVNAATALLLNGDSVVILDSGGVDRTGAVRRKLGATTPAPA